MKRGLVITILLRMNVLAAVFQSDYNHISSEGLNKFTVIGERCSGTNFLEHLVENNFPSLEFTIFGWKHGYAWIELPLFDLRLKNKLNIGDTDHCLFVMVVRDPYDWIRSFYDQPHHVISDLRRGSFYHFISSVWFEKIHMGNHNPYTDKPFKNVFELRKYKILNMLQIGAIVKDFVFVKYEDVEQNPEGFVDYLSRLTGVERRPKFAPVVTYKGEKRPYVKKKYRKFSSKELNFINKEIDWDVEKLVGYSKKMKVK